MLLRKSAICACSGDDISCKESRSNGGSKPRRGVGESREERRVWGLTLNLDPEKRPKDALKDDGARCSSLSRAHFFLKRWKLLLIKFPPRGYTLSLLVSSSNPTGFSRYYRSRFFSPCCWIRHSGRAARIVDVPIIKEKQRDQRWLVG